MHELAYGSLHLEDDGNVAFFDDLDLKESSREEKGVDEMSEYALFRSELWGPSAARVNSAPKPVYELLQRAGVQMPVAAGRVRYEHNSCRLSSQFVGRGFMVGPVRLDAPYFSHLVV